MNGFQKLIAMFGRMALSLIFILSGLTVLLNWQGTEMMLVNAMRDFVGPMEPGMMLGGIRGFTESLIPWASVLLVVATLFQLIGGIFLFLGVKVRFAAFLLLLFLIPTTLYFHHFWLLEGQQRDLQLVMFLKNLSIFGGLLVVLAFGKGCCKKEKKPEKEKEPEKAS